MLFVNVLYQNDIQNSPIFRFFFTYSASKILVCSYATTAFFSLIKQKILQNILDYFINRFGIIKDTFETAFFNINHHTG